MMWLLAGDWSVGQWQIPHGTILSGVAGPDGELVEAPTNPFDGTPLPMPMPLNAIALDDEAAALMLDWFGGDHWEHTAGLDLSHRLVFGAEVNVDAVKARVRARKP